MKNLKKILIALPLVLVMILSVVPVMAENLPVLTGSATKLVTQYGDLTAQLSAKDKDLLTVSQGVNTYPIWLAVRSFAGDSDYDKTTAGSISLLNKGYSVGSVQANPSAASALQIANAFLAANHPEYVIPDYQLNNVMEVAVVVDVPQSWVNTDELKEEKVYTAKEAVLAFDKGTSKSEDDWKNEGAEIYSAKDENEDVYKVTFRGQTVAAEKDADKIKINSPLYYYLKGEKIENPAEVIIDDINNTIKVNVTGVKDGIPVERKVNKVDFMTEAKVMGYLVVVDDKFMPVTVNHHFQNAAGEEILMTEEQQIAKGTELTVQTVNPAWYKQVGGFTIDTTKTVVNPVKEDKTLTTGQVFVTGYTVDLYYTAGEEVQEEEIDAAFAGTQAGVQNANNAAQLPATGAASNAVALIASAAVAFLGFFLKK